MFKQIKQYIFGIKKHPANFKLYAPPEKDRGFESQVFYSEKKKCKGQEITTEWIFDWYLVEAIHWKLEAMGTSQTIKNRSKEYTLYLN